MFGIRNRRAVAAGVGAALLVSGVMVIGANVASGAGTTNGDQVTFAQTDCSTSIGLHQKIDVVAQAVVPNQVGQGESYTVTIPGGTATLPAHSNGLTINSYKNVAQTYEFASSAGSVTVTGTTPGSGANAGTAENNGTPVEFDVTNDATHVTLLTPHATTVVDGANQLDGTLTTPDVTVTITAPSVDATVTTYIDQITTTAIIGTLNVAVLCAEPHSNPQTDGISATLVGAGGPTTSIEPSCRPQAGPCPTTTTTMQSTSSSSVGSTTTTVPSGPTISITDATITRPDKGTAKETFTVTISSAPAKKASVKYETADDSAVSPTDYKHKKGSVSFTPNKLSRTITVNIVGGTIGQPDKSFFVNLSSPVGASILDGQGIGKIVDTHTPGVLIDDEMIPRPTRSKPLVFTLTLTKPEPKGMLCKVAYTTQDLSAHSPVDYRAKHGTVTFKAGKTTATVSITVKPSATIGNAVFTLQLSSPTNCQIVDALAAGTITG
jgi:Calx-beta domain